MGLIPPAPVAIPFWHVLELPSGGTQTIIGGAEHTPSITVIAGIDLACPGFFANSECVIRVVTQSTGTVVLFQAFVYAQSQASFSWRGELPLFTNNSVQAVSVGGTWDIHIWGAVIPTATITP